MVAPWHPIQNYPVGLWQSSRGPCPCIYPTVAARLAAADPDVRPLEGEPGFQLGPGMEVRSVRLPSPMTQGLLEGLCFTRGDGAEVWTAVHRQLPGSWDASLRPPGYDQLVGVEWRRWAANGPCPPVVIWPRRLGPGPSWETIVVPWGWLTIRGVGGHAFTTHVARPWTRIVAWRCNSLRSP